jgi:ribosome biogenesis GTP-binding protein YlqF
MNIQWYPGHMAKAKKSLSENLFLIDIIIEIVDARIPFSSKNPDMKNLAPNKFKILVLNKSDLADEKSTKQFINHYKDYNCVALNSITGTGFNKLNEIINKFTIQKKEKLQKRGRIFSPIRIMVVGIPNVGKSTFINKFVGKKIAKASDRPGVTLSKQWIKIRKDIELLDTPGILWPKFYYEQTALNLAFTGAIKDTNLNTYEIALKLIEKLDNIDKEILKSRYNIKKDSPVDELKEIAQNRGFIKKSGELDFERSAIILLDEFRSGKLGKISLD